MGSNNDTAAGVDIGDIAGAMGITVASESADKSAGRSGDKPGKDSKAHSQKGAKKSDDQEPTGSGIDGAMLDDDILGTGDGSDGDGGSSDDDDSDGGDDAGADDDSDGGGEDGDDSGDDDGADDDSDGDEDGGDDQDDDDDSQAPKSKYQKRIAKLSGQKAKLKQQLAEHEGKISDLEAKLGAATPITLTPTPEDPLADIDSMDALDDKVALAKRVEAWCEDHADGGTLTIDGKERDFDSDEVRTRLKAARNILRAADDRRKFLEHRPLVMQDVRLFYPELTKPGSAEHGAMVQLLKAVPGLKSHPAMELLIGDMIEGQKLRAARYQQLQSKKSGKKAPEGKSRQGDDARSGDGSGKANGGKPKLPRPPQASSGGKRGSGEEVRQTAAAKRLAEGDNSKDAIADYLATLV